MTSGNGRDPLRDSEEGVPDVDRQNGELAASLKFFHEVHEMLALLIQLAIAEARLAAGDLGRCVVLALLAVPVALLAWIGLCVLLSWFAFMASAQAWAGFATFFAIQLLSLLLIARLLARYRKSLSLPETRQQIRAIIKDASRAKKTGGSGSPDTQTETDSSAS